RPFFHPYFFFFFFSLPPPPPTSTLFPYTTLFRSFIATKLVGSSANPFTPSGAPSFDRSLERLRTRRVDLLQVHNLNGVAELIPPDRKSTRLNSSHRTISYAVFCLKKKKKKTT